MQRSTLRPLKMLGWAGALLSLLWAAASVLWFYQFTRPYSPETPLSHLLPELVLSLACLICFLHVARHGRLWPSRPSASSAAAGDRHS